MTHMKAALLLVSVITIFANNQDALVLEDEVHATSLLHVSMEVKSRALKTTAPIDAELAGDEYSIADHLKCSSDKDVAVESFVSANAHSPSATEMKSDSPSATETKTDDPPGTGALRSVLLLMTVLVVLDGVRKSFGCLKQKPSDQKQPTVENTSALQKPSNQGQPTVENTPASESAWVDIVKAARSADEHNFNKAINCEFPIMHTDAWGCTALHFAALGGSTTIATELIKRGADVTALDAWDETPLHIAAREGHASICEMFLGAGASIDAVTKDGLTPLAVAGFANQESTCRILCHGGGGVAGMADNELPTLIVSQMVQKMMAA